MRVALTFDAELPGRSHADPSGAAAILDTLYKWRVPSTWFMQGRWCRLEPLVALRAAEAGHLIGSHSYYHASAPLFSRDGLAEDTRLAEAAIEAATGRSPKPWYRAPNLASNMAVEEVLGEAGYWQPVGADVNPGDWEPSIPAVELVRRVVSGVTAGGVIVCLHTWPRSTVVALPRILAALHGAEFVTVEEL